MSLARRRLTPDFIFIYFLAEALVASAMIYACATTFVFDCDFFSVGHSSTPK